MADDDERELMKGEAAVLHRHEARLPLWVFGLAAGLPAAIVGGGGTALLSTGLLPLAPALAITVAGFGTALLVAGILLTSGVARIAVSEGELDARIGTHHLRIPVEEITSVRVAPSPTRNRGVGVRTTMKRETVYSMLGSPKRAVHLTRRGHAGVTVLVCRQPDALAEAIENARAGTRGPRMRAPEETLDAPSVEQDPDNPPKEVPPEERSTA